MRRTQLYLNESQYRWLRAQARRRGSIAEVVRELIDAARGIRDDSSTDPLIQHLLAETPPTGEGPSTVQTLDDDLYGR